VSQDGDSSAGDQDVGDESNQEGEAEGGPRRPLGISAICVLTGFILLLVVVAMLQLLGRPGGTVPLLVTMFLTVLFVSSIYGLWHLRSWGWWTAIGAYIVNAVYEASSTLVAGGTPSTSALLLAGLAVLVIAYLVSVSDLYLDQGIVESVA